MSRQCWWKPISARGQSAVASDIRVALIEFKVGIGPTKKVQNSRRFSAQHMFRHAFRGNLWQLRLCAAQLHCTAATCRSCCFRDDLQLHEPGGLTCSEMLSEASSCTSRLDCAPAVRLPSCSVLLPGVPHSPPDLASGHSRRFGPACMTSHALW